MFKGGRRKKRKQKGGNINTTPSNKKPSWFSEKTYGCTFIVGIIYKSLLKMKEVLMIG